MNREESEKQKYEIIWAGRYGILNHGLALLKDNPDMLESVHSVLDIGCGSGALLAHLRAHNIQAFGIDIATNCLSNENRKLAEPYFRQACLWSLQPKDHLPENVPFDLGICADVMEHIPQQHVHEALTNIGKLCKTVHFLIAGYPDKVPRPPGMTLHLTVMPATFWQDALSAAMPTKTITRLPHPRRRGLARPDLYHFVAQESATMQNTEFPASFLSFVKGKTVAVVGNAESLLTQLDALDAINSHDIIARMNRGVTITSQQQTPLGRRCDVYCFSGRGRVEPHDMTTQQPKWAFWMTSFNRNAAPTNTLFYPQHCWNKLKSRLSPEARPSTGLMTFDLFYTYTEASLITLFGFDFWKTKTFYMPEIHVSKRHVPSEEKAYILSHLLDPRVSLWGPR